MESITFPHLNYSTAHIALFKNVSCPGKLKHRLIQASTMQGEEGDIERSRVNFAFIDSRLIISLKHLLTAIHQALLAQSTTLLRTKTIHSEILWYLNPTNNIGEAIKLFGVGEKTANLVIVRVESSQLPVEAASSMTTKINLDYKSSLINEMKATLVQGQTDNCNNNTLTDLSELHQLSDTVLLRKVYKLPTSNSNNSNKLRKAYGGLADSSIDSPSTLESLIISVVATKSAQ